MPQDFSHSSVRQQSDDRSFDELRRDIELGLKTLGVAVERTKKEGVDEQSQWAVRRVKTTLDKLRRIPGGDMVVVNRLTAESAQLENELKRAEKAWLLATTNATTSSTTAAGGNFRSEDDDRARLLRANQVLGQSDQVISDIEQNVGESTRTGINTLNVMNSQGQDLELVRRNVGETGLSAKNAAAVLRRMAERAFYNRVFLWFLIAVFFLADVLFLYYGFIKKD